MSGFDLSDDGLIEHLAGSWRLTRRMRDREVENTVSATWVLERRFLQVHMTDTADPPDYEAIVMVGRNDADGRYVAYWCDTFGGRFSAAGAGTRSGDAVEFVFQYPEGPFFNTFTRDPATGTWTFRMETPGDGGTRALFAEDTLRRP